MDKGVEKYLPKSIFFSFVDIKKQEVEDGGRVVGSSLCVVKEDFFFRPLTFCLFYLPDDQYYNSVWEKKIKISAKCPLFIDLFEKITWTFEKNMTNLGMKN